MALAHTALVRYELGAEPLPKLSITETDIAIAFGRRVLHRRVSLNLSQDAMIKQLNYISGGDHGRSSASVWENGHALPSVWTIYGLARVLKSRPEYLAYGVPAFDGSHMAADVLKGADIGEPFNGRSSLTIPRPFFNKRRYRSKR